MKFIVPFLVLVLVTSAKCADDPDLKAAFAKIEADMTNMKSKVSNFAGQLKLLSGQMMMQQLAHEERIRTDGSSGLKQNRVVAVGTRPYYTDSHTGKRIAAVHDHANHYKTVGMGEFMAVLNGLEFKTRHNDYQLRMPSRSKATFGAVDEIRYPDVPTAVTNKKTLQEQIDEMKEWFTAWRDSDPSKRDYRKFFKANLCYLEGYWTLPDGSGNIEEPFESERHQIDASSWHDLIQKVRFSAYTGRKDAGENYAFLPTKIVDMINGTTPVYAQWNYRILCHPLKQDVPLNAFRVIDDFNARRTFPWAKQIKDYAKLRAARFQLNYRFDTTDTWKEGRHNVGMMDKLMGEIPGLDNYQADLVDDAFGYKAYKFGSKVETDPTLNAGYYHRYFTEFKKGAMGSGTRKRSYSDPAIYMAMNTQNKVAQSTLKECRWKGRNCKTYTQRWSYAVPLEIVYTTPLQSWNPFNLAYHGWHKDEAARVVAEGGRNGGVAKPYNGTNSNTYYLTPKALFTGGEISEKDTADTARNMVNVLDKSNTAQQVSASGIRIFIPNIPGVGSLRQRWPIMPVHGEGNGAWKEIDALKDLIMNGKSECGWLVERPDTCAKRRKRSTEIEDDDGVFDN